MISKPLYRSVHLGRAQAQLSCYLVSMGCLWMNACKMSEHQSSDHALSESNHHYANAFRVHWNERGHTTYMLLHRLKCGGCMRWPMTLRIVCQLIVNFSHILAKTCFAIRLFENLASRLPSSALDFFFL